MNRRRFIRNSGLAMSASFMSVHELLAGCSATTTAGIESGARILHLDLITAFPLSEVKKFYTDLLELPLVSEQADRFTFRAGETTITFIQVNGAGAAPFYHFAFNIPENKILKARQWQLKRTPLSATPSHMTDNGYPDDVRHFSSWNAHSIFFWDPAGNLVEYIARHDLKNGSTGAFTGSDLLCASEIAFIVQDTDRVADELKSLFTLKPYRGGDESFRAIGDENGLLLVIKKGRVWESHTGISKTPDIVKTTVLIKADKAGQWKPSGYPFEITVKS